jgi:hypothetical protein
MAARASADAGSREPASNAAVRAHAERARREEAEAATPERRRLRREMLVMTTPFKVLFAAR